MPKRPAHAAPTPSWAVAMLALPVMVAGCASPTEPPPPPGGGASLALSYAEFGQAIEPILTRHGCDAGGDCHGGGIRGTLALSPASAKDTLFDFQQVSGTVLASEPASSLILTEPLAMASGGTTHAVKPFADTSDPDYQVILTWILNGVRP